MYMMNDEERAHRARVKEMHARVRKHDRANRYVNLAWGFVRGFKYRRIERSHRMQRIDSYGSPGEPMRLANNENVVRNHDGWFYEHNFPSPRVLHRLMSASMGVEVSLDDVTAWLSDPDGAVAPPPPRVKSPKRQLEPAGVTA